jgi:pantoate--beta-alanine ligase
MRVAREAGELKEARLALGGRIGFVPTMGALHEGHASLLRRARAECDATVLSIFVNPTQFNNPDDLAKYPATLEADLEMARKEGVELAFAPRYDALYPDGYRYRVSESGLSAALCGACRPGHFDGVLTVVMKLFNLVRPDRAYFGEKDYQQYLLVKGMAEAFFMGLEIVPCATVREADGLAMSSRNRRLSPGDRERAALLPLALREAPTATAAAARLEAAGFLVDYVEDREGRRLAAASLGGTRLIDNVMLAEGP